MKRIVTVSKVAYCPFGEGRVIMQPILISPLTRAQQLRNGVSNVRVSMTGYGRCVHVLSRRPSKGRCDYNNYAVEKYNSFAWQISSAIAGY